MANKCEKVYESNIPWPHRTWVTHTRVAGAESETGRDAWKKGKFPLRDSQGTRLSQARRQNVHFISGKVPERTKLGQVLWGSGKANKSPSQGTIQVHLNPQMEQGSKGFIRKSVVRFVGVCDIIHGSQQKDGPSGLQRSISQTAVLNLLALAKRKKERKKGRNHRLHGKFWRSWWVPSFSTLSKIQLLLASYLYSCTGIALLDLHHYSADQDPWAIG